MTFEQVKGIYTELRDKYEAKLTAYGVKCESEIYCEDDNTDKVDSPDAASYFSLDVNVFTDSIDKDNGLCFCASVPINKLRVDDDDILDEQKAFEESIDEFITRLAGASDVDELIRNEVEDSNRNVEEIMREFERKIKRNSLIALVAVAVCVAAAAVALIANFLL